MWRPHDSEADDLTQEHGAGATDAPEGTEGGNAQMPKQGRAASAEELAGS